MRSRDSRGSDAPFGVRLGGTGRDGRERLHYPDLLLVARDGRRVAIELEITGKSPSARERILAGYAADPRISRVVYLAYTPQVAHALCASVTRLGISSLVSIHVVRPPDRPNLDAGRARGIARPDQRQAGALAR
jgi:hypothetical protein